MDELRWVWTKEVLISNIRQVRWQYGQKQLKNLWKVKKSLLQECFLRELSFAPGKYALSQNACLEVTDQDVRELARRSLPKIVRAS